MNLTTKALLTMGASLIDQFLRIAVNFLLTPYIVAMCGTSGYGIWQMILKASSLLQPLDGRSGECVKWKIARDTNDRVESNKTELVSSAFIYLFLFFPLILFVGIIWYGYSSFYFKENIFNIDSVVAIFIFNILALSVLGFFDGVLRGANLAYKRVGFLSFVTISGGILQYLSLVNGYGLVGLAWIQLFITIFQAFTLYFILRNNISWFGLFSPNKELLRTFSKSAIWFSIWSFINIAIVTIDVLLVGAYFSSDIVAKYTLSLFASQTVIVIVLTAISSVLPGVGSVVGRGNYELARELRDESRLYTWVLATSICAVLLLVNKSFVHLWVGTDGFIGYYLNVALIISSFLMAFIRYESSMLNMALSVKKKVVIGTMSLLLIALTSFPFVYFFDVWGLVISLFIGRLFLYFGYVKEIKKFLCYSTNNKPTSILRSIVTVLLFTVSTYLGKDMIVLSWERLILVAAFLFFSILLILFFVCFSTSEKQNFILRIKKAF